MNTTWLRASREDRESHDAAMLRARRFADLDIAALILSAPNWIFATYNARGRCPPGAPRPGCGNMSQRALDASKLLTPACLPISPYAKHFHQCNVGSFMYGASGWQEVFACTERAQNQAARFAGRTATFIHTYRAGGTSMLYLMRDHCPEGNRICLSTPFCPNGGQVHEGPMQNAFFRESSKSNAQLRWEMSALYGRVESLRFTVVRDPISRLVSAHRELCRRCATPHINLSWPKCWPDRTNGSFLAFVDSITRNGYWNLHVKPQVFTLFNGDRTKVSVNYIGLLSDMDRIQRLVFDHYLHASNASAFRSVSFKGPQPAHGLAHGASRSQLEAGGGNGQQGEEQPPWELQTDQVPHELAMQVCRLYFIDYAALDLPLPDACREEFAYDGYPWLPQWGARAAREPTTANAWNAVGLNGPPQP